MSGLLTLAIENSNPTHIARVPGPGVCVGRVHARGEVEVLGVEPLRALGRHEDDLMPAIDRLCTRLAISARHLQLVAVSCGPGGYTALRVSVAAAKMIAEVAGARCACVPSALVLALADRVRDHFSGERLRADFAGAQPVAIALAGKGERSFITRVDLASVAALDEGSLLDADGVAALAKSGVTRLIGDEHTPEAIIAQARGLGMAIAEPRFDPVACLLGASMVEAIDPVALLPIYGREPEAVTLWNARKGS